MSIVFLAAPTAAKPSADSIAGLWKTRIGRGSVRREGGDANRHKPRGCIFAPLRKTETWTRIQ